MKESTTILQGNCLEVLPTLRAESVHCVVTSPPYWGLRDYGIKKSKWPTGWLGCHGLEPTIELYVEHEVLIFREVRRVLRRDGTLWLNLGDTYAGGGLGGGGSFAQDGIRMCAEPGSNKNVPARAGSRLVQVGLKAKDLAGAPWRVALALQADGWWLRSDNVWHKTNPMPESVTDRPTRAHEYVFLLTKSKRYFYDLEAVKEEVSWTAHARSSSANEFPANTLRDDNRRRGVHPKAKMFGANSRACVDRDAKHVAKVKANRSYSAAMVGYDGEEEPEERVDVWDKSFSGCAFCDFSAGIG